MHFLLGVAVSAQWEFLVELNEEAEFSKAVLLSIWKQPLTGHLPTHSLSVICRATVLWTRKGSPEPLPEVQEWSSRSWEREIQKQRVKSLYIYMCLCVHVCVYLQVSYLNENLPKGIPRLKPLKKWWNKEHLGLRWWLIQAGCLWCGAHMGWKGAGRVCTTVLCVSGCVSALEGQSAPCWVNNRSVTPSLVTGVGVLEILSNPRARL